MWAQLVETIGSAGQAPRILLRGPPGNGQEELAAHLSSMWAAWHAVWDAAAWEGDRGGATGSLEALRRYLDDWRGRALLEVRGLECASRVASGFPAYLAGWLGGLGPTTVVLAHCEDDHLPHALTAIFGNGHSVVVEVGPPGPADIWAMAQLRLSGWPPQQAEHVADSLSGLHRDDVWVLLSAVADAPDAWEAVLAGRGVAVFDAPTAAEGAPECPLCCLPVSDAEAVRCPGCGTVHHKTCWGENGGCTTYGCGVVG